MAASKLFLFCIFLALIFTKIKASELSDSDITAHENDVVPSPDVSESSLKIELDQLKSKIASLEYNIEERTRESRSKDESIKQLEKLIEEKSANVASLHDEIQLLQEKRPLDAKEQVAKVHARAIELETQVDNLKKELETQNKKKDALEARTNAAEKQIQDLNVELENLQRINDEQNKRIRKAERALQVTEEEMVKAKLEASYISKELSEVHGAWLPPWLAVHLVHCQSSIVTQWHQHGKPALDVTIQKALEKKAQFDKWMEPQIDTLKTKWIPIIKEHGLAFVSNIEPHVYSLTTKTVDGFHASKNYIEPQVVKVQKMMNPYFQETRKFTKPYIDQVSTVMKPHVDKARIILKPYTKKVVRSYKKFIKTASKYHRQAQTTIQQQLKDHDFTKPFATNELVWFMATFLMALPVIFLFQMASAIFCTKRPKTSARNSNKNHTRRRAKRLHADK